MRHPEVERHRQRENLQDECMRWPRQHGSQGQRLKHHDQRHEAHLGCRNARTAERTHMRILQAHPYRKSIILLGAWEEILKVSALYIYQIISV